jgi:PAS domain S-box-containing protein
VWLLELLALGAIAVAAGAALALARARRAATADPRRAALLALMPGGALVVGRGGGLLEFNAEAHGILGYTRDEFAALSVEDLDGAEAPGDLGEQIRRAFAGERVELELTLRTRSGDRCHVQLRARAAEGWGRPAVLVTLLDVTGRLRTEHALRTAHRAVLALSRCNEALIRSPSEQALFDQLCSIIVEEGGYRMCWVGLAEDDARRTVRPVAVAGAEEGYLRTLDVVWDGDQPRGRGPTGTAIRSGKPVVSRDYASDQMMTPWRAEALRRGYRSGAALPLVSEGRVFGCVSIYAAEADAFDDAELHFLMQLAEDVSFGVISRRARADRDRLTAQLAQTDRLVAMGTLAAGVAHEINNPLAYVMASQSFLAEGLARLRDRTSDPALPELADALHDAREGCERVRQIVRDLRTFSRVDDARIGPVELAPVLESCLAMARSELKHRAVVTKDFRPAPQVLASEAKLGQVFLNLLINAAQAIPPGHPHDNEIHLATSTDAEGRATIEVSDTGPGVPAELRERIFDPFFTTKRIGEGTGLGLSICRNIVTAAGGQISVHPSAGGRGATFRVVLPPAPRSHRAATPAPPTRATPGRRGRVAVVDDEPAIRRAAERLLAPEHEVVAFADARAVAERIREGERFDAILCDILMPGMTGIDLHRHLQDVAPSQADAIIFITGGAFTSEGRAFLDGVQNPVLEKPFDTPAVRRAIRALVR